jgi:hypothetical protein
MCFECLQSERIKLNPQNFKSLIFQVFGKSSGGLFWGTSCRFIPSPVASHTCTFFSRSSLLAAAVRNNHAVFYPANS